MVWLAPVSFMSTDRPFQEPTPVPTDIEPGAFEVLVPYLQHATFGLLLFPEGYASLGQGNKIAQYSYCRLPIVAPTYLEADRPNVCGFAPGDRKSLGRALAEAERMPHSSTFAAGIMSAEELGLILAGEPQARETA